MDYSQVSRQENAVDQCCSVRVKRVDKTLPLPLYETLGSVGFDLLARKTTVIPPKKIGRIPSNLIVEVPEGYALILVPRSSTPVKKGLSFPHSVGVIDRDYCGPKDEILIQVYNFSDKDVVVERAEKVAQGLFVRTDRLKWCEVDELRPETRGGFGSTD